MDSPLLIGSKNALIYANYIRSSKSVSLCVCFLAILRIIEFKIFFLSLTFPLGPVLHMRIAQILPSAVGVLERGFQGPRTS